jgi:hypothetical protein
MKRVMNRLEKLCIKWLNENFNSMEPFYMEEYPDYIFHMKDGKCILQHNKKNGYVYVSYREIWKFFESYFSMSNQQIKDITKIWVEEHYKMNVTSIKWLFRWLHPEVEEHYKMNVTTTSTKYSKQQKTVEEHYKMNVTTINSLEVITGYVVEEHYKMNITTTNNQNDFYFEREVEELYNQHTNG